MNEDPPPGELADLAAQMRRVRQEQQAAVAANDGPRLAALCARAEEIRAMVMTLPGDEAVDE